MDISFLVQKNLINSELKKIYLYQLPILKNCPSWNDVEEIGLVDFVGKHAIYDGGLVSYNGKYYYLPKELINNLRPYRKWTFRKNIAIV